MFTILNLLNYSIGKKINTFVLILLSICIYVGLIKYYYDTIHANTIYTVTLLILMLIDIISIILIFFYFKDSSDSNNIVMQENKINKIIMGEKDKKEKKDKKDSKDKKDNNDKKDSKDKKEKKESKDKKELENNAPTQTFIKGNDEKELISLYDVNKDVSLATYK